MTRWLRKRVLITVRTYPTPARQGIEVSCTAGVTDDGEWIRLFPVPYRYIEANRQFHKYQWIDVATTRSSDGRPESFKIDIDSINILGPPLSTRNSWAARKAVLAQLTAHCMCCLKRQLEDKRAPTLGFFRPHKIERLIIASEPAEWTASELARLRQSTFLEHAPQSELEKIPYKFSYRYWCDHPECESHTMMCSDWEMLCAAP